MSLGEAIAALLLLRAGAEIVVLPKPAFSLFDLKRASAIEPIHEYVSASAGVAVPATTIYTCPPHKIVLLLGISDYVTKATATAMTMYIQRKITGALAYLDGLIAETQGTGYASWPSAKAAAQHTIGYHICLLFPGDIIRITHALTAAETITHEITIHRIEYTDPRYQHE